MKWFLYWRRREFFEAQLRIERASKHLKELETLLEPYGEHDFNSVDDDVYGEGYVDTIDVGPLESSTVQVVIGDIVHNLRSALNYIAVGVWRNDSPEIEIPKTFQFPIESREDIFSKHRATRMKGVNDKHIALFKRYQPYAGCDWTRMLVDLSNTDKHYNFVRVDLAIISWKEALDTETTEGEACMQVYRVTTHEVAFPDDIPIIEKLQEIQTQVTNVLEEFNTCIMDEFKVKVATVKRAKK